MPNPNFIIYSLARGRTKWLSEFLTYADWRCFHEIAICMREPSDLTSFLNLPRVGTVETAATFAWPLIHFQAPKVKAVVVRRDVEQAIQSMIKADERLTYDLDKLRDTFRRADKILDKIEKLPNVLTVKFDDLVQEEVCKSVFEFCLPYKHDSVWWNHIKDQNLQVDVKHLYDYYQTNKQDIEDFKRKLKVEMFRLARTQPFKDWRVTCPV